MGLIPLFFLPAHKQFRRAGNITLLIGLLLCLTASANAADEILFSAEYQGKYSGMLIKSTRELSKTPDGQFMMRSEIKNSLASIREESRFSVQDGILHPLGYHYRRKILAFKADEKLLFDWHNQQVQYRRKNKPEKNRDLPLQTGVLDPALYQLQIQREIFWGKDKMAITFAKPAKIKTLHFEKTGDETITVGKTEYRAIKVERDNRDDDKQTRLWLVPELNFQVARVEHVEENGDTYNIHLTAYSGSASLLDAIYSAQPNTTPEAN